MFMASPRTTGRVNLTNHTVSDIEGTPTVATASISIQSDGAITFTGNGSDAAPSDEWWTRQPITGIGGSYDVRLEQVSGDAPTSGPALATWHALSSTRTWTWATSGVGTLSASMTLRIRPTGGAEIDSSTITVDVQEIT